MDTFEEGRYLVFDIETYADMSLKPEYVEWKIADKVDKRLKDPFKIEESKLAAKEKFALSPRTGKIILIGFYDSADSAFERYSDKDFSEKEILAKAWEVIHGALMSGKKLVGFNSKRFDISYMVIRSMILGVEIPESFDALSLLKKWFPGSVANSHIDLYEILDTMDSGPLNEMTYLMGIQSEELENRGNEIGELYKAGNYPEIIRKNKDDLERTAELYERVRSFIK